MSDFTAGLTAKKGGLSGDWRLIDPQSGMVVGVAHGLVEFGSPNLEAPAKANARLWAAASELFALIEKLAPLLNEERGFYISAEKLRSYGIEAQRLLAKVQGTEVPS